jgi:hypothetical protein
VRSEDIGAFTKVIKKGSIIVFLFEKLKRVKDEEFKSYRQWGIFNFGNSSYEQIITGG